MADPPMPPPAQQGQTDEELEIQMAIALSLQEVHASQLQPEPPTAPAGAAAEPGPGVGSSRPAVPPPAPQPTSAGLADLQALLAHALSSAFLPPGVGGNASSSGQVPAAPPAAPLQPQPPPPPPPAPPQAPPQQQGGMDMAAELARQFALFQQTFGQGSGPSQGPGGPAPSSSSATPHSAVAQQGGATTGPAGTSGRSSTARPSSASVFSPAPTPTWAAGLVTWYSPGAAAPGAASTGLEDVRLGSPAEVQQLLEVLSKALGTKVVLAGDPSGLWLKVSSDHGGGDAAQLVRGADLTSLLSAWLRRPSLLASGTSQMRALQAAFTALPSPATLQGGVATCVAAAAALLGKLAFRLLADDEEDLYFETGQHVGEFLRDLRTPGRMAPPFMRAIVRSVADPAGAGSAAKLLRLVIEEAKAIKQLGTSVTELEPLALSLDVVTAPPEMQRCLAHLLVEELRGVGWAALGSARGASSPAKLLEATSILSPLLQLSSLVDPLSVLSRKVTSRASATIQAIKGFPNAESEITRLIDILSGLQARAQDVTHGLLKRVVTLKEGVAPGTGREVTVAWLAGAARLNWERTLAGERGIAARIAAEVATGASDTWCVTVTAVCLRFARPFVEGYWDTKAGKFADLFTKHLSPYYYASQPHRLPDLAHVHSLAGERGHSVADAVQALPAAARGPATAALPSPTTPWLLPALRSGPDAPSFIADCFFVTQTWIHVGLLPALYRYQRLVEVLQGWMGSEDEGKGGDKSHLAGQLTLLVACERAALLDPRLVEDTVQFCMLQVCWLHHLSAQPDAATSLALVPDYVLADSLTWLSFVVSSGLAVHVASKDVGALTAALAGLLGSPHAGRSPVLADKAVRLLLTMLAPQLGVAKRTAARGTLAPEIQRPGEAALVAAVLNSPAAQSGALVGALMQVYVAADHVVGLDVDRDSFDKFTMRSCVDSILEELWRDDRGRRSVLALAGGGSVVGAAPLAGHDGGHVFDEYVGCLFNSLIYLFKDSLDRLVDIAKVEAARADEAGWAARPPDDRDRQQSFLESQQKTCRGFMRIAVAALGWLNTLASHPTTGAALCRPPLNGRVAYSCLNFLELLTNARAQSLTVERPQQYGWDRVGLLGQVVGLFLALSASPEGTGLVAALEAEPDLDLATLERAHAQLEAAHAVREATGLSQLMERLSSTIGRAAGTAEPPSAAPPPAKRSRIEDGVNGDATASPGGQAMATADGNRDGDVHMADATASSSYVPLELPGPPPCADDQLPALYSEQLGELSLGTFESGAPRAYHSAFNAMANEGATGSGAMMKRVAREVRDMAARTRLPCEPSASIFLRYDGEAMYKMRALLTGPKGTPYAYGCFFFDMLFPSGYPNTPMLMNFETTGQGRARFNPNLYADGKVCLSLINTWHASHESEKWSPERTTTFQVLMSIQAMILVEDPYYNEPAHEVARNTDTGRTSSAEYNAHLTLNTIRWAMVDKLRHPPPGFEEVVRRHFRLLRHKVLGVANDWARAALETGDEPLARRTQAAVQELRDLLAAL